MTTEIPDSVGEVLAELRARVERLELARRAESTAIGPDGTIEGVDEDGVRRLKYGRILSADGATDYGIGIVAQGSTGGDVMLIIDAQRSLGWLDGTQAVVILESAGQLNLIDKDGVPAMSVQTTQRDLRDLLGRIRFYLTTETVAMRDTDSNEVLAAGAGGLVRPRLSWPMLHVSDLENVTSGSFTTVATGYVYRVQDNVNARYWIVTPAGTTAEVEVWDESAGVRLGSVNPHGGGVNVFTEINAPLDAGHGITATRRLSLRVRRTAGAGTVQVAAFGFYTYAA